MSEINSVGLECHHLSNPDDGVVEVEVGSDFEDVDQVDDLSSHEDSNVVYNDESSTPKPITNVVNNATHAPPIL